MGTIAAVAICCLVLFAMLATPWTGAETRDGHDWKRQPEGPFKPLRSHVRPAGQSPFASAARKLVARLRERARARWA